MTHSADDPDSRPGSNAVHRILDANGNRAGEALRVIEEACRFLCDDREMTKRVKTLRHELSAALDHLDPETRLRARDTRGDVGTEIETDRESRRDNLAHVLLANFQRLSQSLRALEEYSKMESGDCGRAFEAIRYRAYSLEQAVVLSVLGGERRKRLSEAKFYVLMDGRNDAESMQQAAAEIAAAGADVIQLRDKSLADAELVARARAMREVVSPPTLFIVNDRPDIALLCEADGVHVGQDELAVADARRLLGPHKLVGVSTHDIGQAVRAAGEADYIGCGPTFPSSTKSFESFPGLEFLRQVVAEVQVPAFAIGGIGLDNIERVYETGISRVALSGAIWNADCPPAELHKLRELGEEQRQT